MVFHTSRHVLLDLTASVILDWLGYVLIFSLHFLWFPITRLCFLGSDLFRLVVDVSCVKLVVVWVLLWILSSLRVLRLKPKLCEIPRCST